jgi:hypothetical protein
MTVPALVPTKLEDHHDLRDTISSGRSVQSRSNFVRSAMGMSRRKEKCTRRRRRALLDLV